MQSKATLVKASLVTIIADRERDIYGEWYRIPDKKTHLLAVIALRAAVQTMQLILARDRSKTERPASDVFRDEEDNILVADNCPNFFMAKIQAFISK